MKNILIILAILFIAVTVKAQWFLGGEISLNVSSLNENSSYEYADRITNSTEVGFLIAPKFGYYFNDKFSLGLSLSVGPNFKINESTSNNQLSKSKEYAINWRIFPFVRYSVFTYKKFALILEGRTGIGCAHYFWKLEDHKVENTANTLAIGVFNITPILGFNFTDHFQMEAGLHFLNIGYNIDIIKGDYYPSKINSIKHDFNIGFNSSSILVMTQLKFGVIYKF